MLYAWGLLSIFSLFLPHYLKDLLSSSVSYFLHVFLGVCVLSLSFFGFLAAVFAKSGGTDSSHFSSTHSLLGLAVCFSLILVTLFGAMAKPEREIETRKWPLFLHQWCGRLVVIAAFFDCFLGFYSYESTSAKAWTCGALWVFVIIIFVILFELFHRGDVPSHTIRAKEFEMLERGVRIIDQNNTGLLWCFGALGVFGCLLVTLMIVG